MNCINVNEYLLLKCPFDSVYERSRTFKNIHGACVCVKETCRNRFLPDAVTQVARDGVLRVLLFIRNPKKFAERASFLRSRLVSEKRCSNWNKSEGAKKYSSESEVLHICDENEKTKRTWTFKIITHKLLWLDLITIEEIGKLSSYVNFYNT